MGGPRPDSRSVEDRGVRVNRTRLSVLGARPDGDDDLDDADVIGPSDLVRDQSGHCFFGRALSYLKGHNLKRRPPRFSAGCQGDIDSVAATNPAGKVLRGLSDEDADVELSGVRIFCF